MDSELLGVVASRLDRDASIDDEAGLLVLAACEGDDELAEALVGEAGAATTRLDLPPTSLPRGTYLSRIEAEGFRGVGPRCAIQFTPGPGLTLVVGRNGSGKSSFVEALEVLLTGDSRRWSGRNEKAWREGWRNLHHPDPTSVRAEFVLDGTGGATTAAREWRTDAEIDDADTYAQIQGQKRKSINDLGWSEALASYRPILSYNELGSILDDGPSKLYDALVGILGLEELTDALARLSGARLSMKKLVDAAKAEAKVLLTVLEETDDERARTAEGLLKAKKWDLKGISQIATGTAETVLSGDLEVLRSFANLSTPDAEMVTSAVARARAAADLQDAVRGTEAEAASRTADLLEAALEHHEHEGDGPCPVCGVGTLTHEWVTATTDEIDSLRRSAREARNAKDSVREAALRIESLQHLPTASFPEGQRVGIPIGGLRSVWEAWLAVPVDDVRAAAAQIESLAPRLTNEAIAARAAAAAMLVDREDRWSPVAEQLAAWLEGARRAERLAGRRDVVDRAEQWVKQVIADLRDERLAPLAAQSQEIWRQLSQHSNVELGPIQLSGSGTRRRVALDVTVDGVESVALAVMSQGELHALALAIFLPRVTATPSPFRFLIIDDPVQAMDPARVEGLARVLEETAKTHQVIVFTHDDRLPQAVRTLRIEANVLKVTRRSGSVVEITPGGDPAVAHLDDAMAVALTTDLPDDAKARVVPGYCRLALEAVLNDLARRKLLGAGVPHAEVEERLASVARLTSRAALALFGDADKGGDVLSRLGAYGKFAQDAYQAVNKGTHDGYGGDLVALVRDTRALFDKLRTAS